MKRFHFEATTVVPYRANELPYVAFSRFQNAFEEAEASAKNARKIGDIKMDYVVSSDQETISISWSGNFDLPGEKEANELQQHLSRIGKTITATHTLMCEAPEDSRKPWERSSVWLRLGVSLDVSVEEEKILLSPTTDYETLKDLLIRLVDNHTFQVTGESYIPATVIQDMNAENGTYYPDGDDITIEL